MGSQWPIRLKSQFFFRFFHMGRIFETFHMGQYFSLKADSNTVPMHIRNRKSVHWRLRYDFLNMTMFAKNHVFRPFWVDGGSDWWPFLKNLSMQKLFYMVIDQILKISLESKNFFFRWHFFKKYVQVQKNLNFKMFI